MCTSLLLQLYCYTNMASAGMFTERGIGLTGSSDLQRFGQFWVYIDVRCMHLSILYVIVPPKKTVTRRSSNVCRWRAHHETIRDYDRRMSFFTYDE
jgi:hypothetical protein